MLKKCPHGIAVLSGEHCDFCQGHPLKAAKEKARQSENEKLRSELASLRVLLAESNREIERLREDANLLKSLCRSLEGDAHAYWLPEWGFNEESKEHPTMAEFREQLASRFRAIREFNANA